MRPVLRLLPALAILAALLLLGAVPPPRTAAQAVAPGAAAPTDPAVRRTWDGGGADNDWTTPANWVSLAADGDETAPEPGDDLVFPDGTAEFTSNTFAPYTAFNSITIQGAGYTLIGNAIDLGSSGLSASYASGSSTVRLVLRMPAGGATIQAQQPNAELRIDGAISLDNGPVTFGGGGTIRVNGPISQAGSQEPFGVTKTGGGLLILTAGNAYAGPTMVTAGTLQLNGSIGASAVTVQQMGTLSGGGGGGGNPNIEQSLTLAGGAVGPGNEPGATSVLTTGPATLAGGTYSVDVGTTSTGSRSDQLAVTGSVTLSGAGLVVQPVPSNPPSPDQEFIIVANDGADAVSGTFAGLAEGDTVPVGSIDLRISYVGGDGNDVSLTAAAPEPPTITSITPNYGPAAGGTEVEIEGSGFSTEEDATQFVNFQGTPQFTNVRCEDASTCTAESVATDTFTFGTSSVNIAAEVNGVRGPFGAFFTWYGPPNLDSITPTQGPAAGGNRVTLAGFPFPSDGSPGPVTVRFGDAAIELPADGPRCEETDACTVTAPRGSGTVEVTIETPGGVSDPLPYTYTRPRPAVTGINPTRGRQAGNDRVTIRGTNLAPPSSAAAGPAGPGGPGPGAGPGDDDADAGAGDGVIGGDPIPVDPGPGAEPGAGTLVQFGTAVATNVSCNADGTECTALSPAGPMGGGTVSVRVTVNSEQSEDTDADDFTYVAAPVVTDDSATTPFGTSIAIDVLANDSGDGIHVTAVTQPANGSATINSDGAISYTPRTGFSGTDSFTYTITDAVSQTASAGVTVTVGFPAPTIAAVTPPSGPAAGGTPVTITGSGFQQGAAVRFDGLPATQVTVIDATTLQATTPAHPVGPVAVSVHNPDGQGASLPGGFTYIELTPTVSSVGPSQGPEAGGTPVSITGTDFRPGETSVSFGGVPASGVDCPSPTACTAVSPPGQGTVSVRVTVAGRTSPETAAATFTYAPPPQPMTLGVQVWRQLPPLVSEGQTEGTIVPVVGGVVEALIGGVVCGQGVTDGQGRVQLVVAADPSARGCGRDGVAISFRVNGAAAAGDPLSFRSGGQAAVTLILPGPMPPPRR